MGKRVIIIVLDSVGAGYMDDAADFGDTGANTLANTADAAGGLHLPNLEKLGLGNIIRIKGVDPVAEPLGKFGRIREASTGKDTMTGHWEMMGIISKEPFPLYPEGFPDEIVDEFIKRTGVKGILGNIAASGTEIIKELGREHMRSGFPIVYTSGDSVFQIAAHNETIPLDRLYSYCIAAREMCDKYRIGRVIARPFKGAEGRFIRTADRRDYPMRPPGDTVLDLIKMSGFRVTGIGKIEDIYAKQGISRAIHTQSNGEGMDILTEEIRITNEGLIFINLVDFDMLYGHRRDAEGYASALEEFDKKLGDFLPQIGTDDLLIITSDHGCDPTFRGTDHTREFVPLLVFGQGLSAENLNVRETLADIGVSALEYLGIGNPGFPGKSFI